MIGKILVPFGDGEIVCALGDNGRWTCIYPDEKVRQHFKTSLDTLDSPFDSRFSYPASGGFGVACLHEAAKRLGGRAVLRPLQSLPPDGKKVVY